MKPARMPLPFSSPSMYLTARMIRSLPSTHLSLSLTLRTLLCVIALLLPAIAAFALESPSSPGGGGGGGGLGAVPQEKQYIPPTRDFSYVLEKGKYVITARPQGASSLDLYYNTWSIPDSIDVYDDDEQILFSTNGPISGDELSVTLLTGSTKKFFIKVDAPISGTEVDVSGNWRYDQPIPPGASTVGCPRVDITLLQSKVVNSLLAHVHDAVDLATDPQSTGCGACGASGPGSGSGIQRAVRIQRIHRYLDQFHPGSFGPGVFSNLDIQLTLWGDGSTGELFDPQVDKPILLSGAGGTLSDVATSQVKVVRLLRADNSPASNLSLATKAVVDLHDGGAYEFDLIQSGSGGSADRQGRLTVWRATDGSALNITYAFPVGTTEMTVGVGKLQRLREMLSVRDATGRTVTFQYGWSCGQPVITKITAPSTDVISYRYDGAIAGLAGITYPDGTASQFDFHYDDEIKQAIVDYSDAGAEGMHRTKRVFFTALGRMGTQPPTSANRVRRVEGPTGEVSYFNYWYGGGDYVVIYAYEGGTRVVQLQTQNGIVINKLVADNYTGQSDITTLDYHPESSPGFDAHLRMSSSVDPFNRATTWDRDPVTGAVLAKQVVDLPTNTVLSRETTTYNARQQPLRHVDANGVVTVSSYDGAGNLLSRIGGITVSGGIDDLSKSSTTSWTYRSDNQTSTMTNPSGLVTTYGYDAQGRRTSQSIPGDAIGAPAIVTTWTYDSAGRLEWSYDAAGRGAHYRYDGRNRPWKVEYDDGSFEQSTYGTGADANLLIAKLDRDGHRIDFFYDLAGREIGRLEGADDAAHAVPTTTTYVPGTDLVETVNRAGVITTYTYTEDKQVATATRNLGNGKLLTEDTAYDAVGRVSCVTDAFNRRTWSVYDGLDRVTRTIRESVPFSVDPWSDMAMLARPSGVNPPYVITESAYDAGGRLLRATDANGVVTAYGYDPQGHVVSTTEAEGTSVAATTTALYDAASNRTQETDPLGRITKMAYLPRGLLASRTQAWGTADAATTSYTYTVTGQRATMTDPRGKTTTFAYGTCCDRLVSVTDPEGFLTSLSYSPSGLQTSVTDPLLHTTGTAYDALRRPTTVTDARGKSTTTVYDDNLTDGLGLDSAYVAAIGTLADRAACHAQAITNAMGETVLRVSDADGRPRLVRDAANRITTTVYDQIVNVGGIDLIESVTTDPLGRVTRHRVDGLGLERFTIIPPANAGDAVATITATFDANRNQLSITDPNGVSVSRTFDARSRVKQMTDARGVTLIQGYDAVGNVFSRTEANGAITSWTYTARNQRKTETDQLTKVTGFTYDLAGNLLTITDAQNSVTTYAYTDRGQVKSETFPPPTGGARQYTYDGAGRLWTRLDQAGVTTTYGYDNGNRLTSRAYSTGVTDLLGYDDANRLTSASSGRYQTSISRTYENGLLKQEVQQRPSGSASVTTTYDNANQPTTLTLDDGTALTSTLTDRGQSSAVGIGGATIASRTYDAGGRIFQTTLINGLREKRTYDQELVSRLQVGTAAQPSSVEDLSYGFDANRRKTSEADVVPGGEAQTFGYDTANRLTSWSRTPGLIGSTPPVKDTQSWTLTDVGDWLSNTLNGIVQARTHSAVHEATAVSGAALTYDVKGNLTKDHTGVVYTWDEENRLATVTVRDPAEGVTSTARMVYDALGRRLSRTAFKLTTAFVQQGAQVLQERDSKLAPTSAEQASDGVLPPDTAPAPEGSVLQMAGTRHLNHQPASEEIPSGWIADKGRPLATRTNGLMYGWVNSSLAPTALASAQSVVRDFMPQPELDTFNRLTNGGPAFLWRYSVANGTYPVAIMAGDPTSLMHTNHLTLNGATLTDPDPYNASGAPSYNLGDFDGWVQTVTVTDGYITIGAGAGAVDPDICWIEIGPKDAAVDQATRDRMTQRVTDATNRTGGPAYRKSFVDTRTFVYGGDYIDAPLAMRTKSGSTTIDYFPHANSLHSIQAVTDATGQIVEQYSYSAYGDRSIVGSNNKQSAINLTVGFTGLRTEGDLLYARKRYMSPALGRWISRDSLGYIDGKNLYGAYFTPNGLDPTGLYNEAGHFYTTFLVGLSARMGVEESTQLAYWSQYPDEDGRYDAIQSIWKNNDNWRAVQIYLHSLNGASPQCTQNALRELLMKEPLEVWQKGMVIHAFGDSYAHVNDATGLMYNHGWGHTNDGTAPDHITSSTARLVRYYKYITNLHFILGGNNRFILDPLVDVVRTVGDPDNEIQNIGDLARANGLSSDLMPETQGGFFTDGMILPGMTRTVEEVRGLMSTIAKYTDKCMCKDGP